MIRETQAYFLVAHGSRHRDPSQSLEQLCDYFRLAVDPSGLSKVQIRSGCLEFQNVSLCDQLVEFYLSLPYPQPCIQVLPIFLLPGNHVRHDIPTEIQQAQAKIQALTAHLAPKASHQSIKLCPHLGSHPVLRQVMQSSMTAINPQAWILVGHGSRRLEGNLMIQQLAKDLRASPAFWASPPSLTDRIQEFQSQGVQWIGIIPYFLFSGHITQAITSQVEQVMATQLELQITVLPAIHASPALGAALFELSQTELHLPIMTSNGTVE